MKNEENENNQCKIPKEIEKDENYIVAYALDQNDAFNPNFEFVIKPAPLKRKWMEDTGTRAYKCLPLCMANQCGWIITLPVGFTCVWDGGENYGSVKFDFDEDPSRWKKIIIERFGVGTFTIPIPYVWRTPPGWEIFTREPPNSYKTNCTSLDAVIETEWLPYPFFQTWKIKRPNEPVRFEKGEPYAFVHLINIDFIKECDLYVDRISDPSNEELRKEVSAWSDARTSFQEDIHKQIRDGIPVSASDDWQKDYTVGRLINGQNVPRHNTNLGDMKVNKGKCPFFNKGKENDS